MSDFDTVTLPEKHYAGYQWRDEGVLGFLTPFGTDAAGLKRRDTVDHWRDKKDGMLTPDVLDNVPQTGFRIVRNVSRYMTKNVVWRVMDPRGFELEITSANMSMLLQSCAIKNGVIETDCIWGRDNRGNNVLVSVESEVYKGAVELTDLKGKKVSLKDLNPGDSVRLQNREEGVYFGKLNYCTHGAGYFDARGNPSERYYNSEIGAVEWHRDHATNDVYVLRKDTGEQAILEGAEVYFYEHMNSAPKVAERTAEATTALTKREVIEMLTRDLEEGYTVGEPTRWNRKTYDRKYNGYFYVEKKSDIVPVVMDFDGADFTEAFSRVPKTEARWNDRWETGPVGGDVLSRPVLFEKDGTLHVMLYQSAAYAYSAPVTLTLGEDRIKMVTSRTTYTTSRGYWGYESTPKTEDAWFKHIAMYYGNLTREPLAGIHAHKYQTIGYKDKTVA